MISRPPLVLVGHGTRSAVGVAEFRRFVERVRGLAGEGLPAVDGGFIELSSPSVTEAVAAMPVGTHPDMVAVPLVLTAAGHGKGDIPASLARERQLHPGLRWRYGRPLGPHPVLLDLLAKRIDAALAGEDPATAQVLLVGRGSSDPDANAEVAKVARLLWEGRGYAGAEFCFVSLAQPSVPAALGKIARIGADRVVVVPYFLFSGVLPDRVASQARGFAAGHQRIDVRVAGLIGDCDELAGLVLERYEEAIHGDIRMNCDTCAYRIAMPGFADKVGRAQTPHHHPDDDHPHAHAHPRDLDLVDRPRDRVDLRHHGDTELAAGLVDLAVNVRRPEPPQWLRAELARTLTRLAAYPDPAPATHAVAARHGRRDDEVLLTAGAAEAFVLIARVLRPSCAVVVHPQFTEPEAALRAAGHPVRRVLLSPADGFRLTAAAIPQEADLVMIGNPTNPTSVLHPAALLASLARPGRVLVVDEAFMDAVPGEPESLAGSPSVPGLLVVRSLTKTWGLAGLRIGYLLGDPALLGPLRGAQPLWAVSTPALAAARACCSPRAVAEAAAMARASAEDRAHLTRLLRGIEGVELTGDHQGPFLLIRVADGLAVRDGLRRRGFAVRRGDTFPGLGPDWLRVAVRDAATSDAFADSLREVLK